MEELSPNDYNGAQLIVVSIILLSVTSLSVGLRVFVRCLILKTFSWDDWLMVAAQAVFTLSCSFILAGVHYGIGRHDVTLPVPERIQGLKYQALATLTYVANMMFIKLSIAIFLLRIAIKKKYIYTLRISMAVVLIWSLATIFFDIFQCTPVAAQWDFTIENFKCAPGSSFVAAAYSISVMTVLTDWMYAIIPIPMIWSVQMTLQKKMTVAFVLSLGVFASIATLIRVKYLVELSDYSDILFTGTTAMIWTLVEPGVAITAASLITIRPLLQALNFPGFDSVRNTSRQYGNSTSLSQTLQNRSQNANTNNAGREFRLKEWQTLSEGGGKAENTSSGRGLESPTTTAPGSEENILRTGESGNDGGRGSPGKVVVRI